MHMFCNDIIATKASLQLHILSNDAFSYYMVHPSVLAYRSNQS